MSVGTRIIYNMVDSVFGRDAETWLDTPQTGLSDTPELEVTPRSLIESGCPACINSVVDALEAVKSK